MATLGCPSDSTNHQNVCLLMGPLPVQPPKPRVVKLGDTWVLDTGHADVLHDSWADAIRHAERICGDYVRRLSLWVAMNRPTERESGR